MANNLNNLDLGSLIGNFINQSSQTRSQAAQGNTNFNKLNNPESILGSYNQYGTGAGLASELANKPGTSYGLTAPQIQNLNNWFSAGAAPMGQVNYGRMPVGISPDAANAQTAINQQQAQAYNALGEQGLKKLAMQKEIANSPLNLNASNIFGNAALGLNEQERRGMELDLSKAKMNVFNSLNPDVPITQKIDAYQQIFGRNKELLPQLDKEALAKQTDFYKNKNLLVDPNFTQADLVGKLANTPVSTQQDMAAFNENFTSLKNLKSETEGMDKNKKSRITGGWAENTSTAFTDAFKRGNGTVPLSLEDINSFRSKLGGLPSELGFNDVIKMNPDGKGGVIDVGALKHKLMQGEQVLYKMKNNIEAFTPEGRRALMYYAFGGQQKSNPMSPVPSIASIMEHYNREKSQIDSKYSEEQKNQLSKKLGRTLTEAEAKKINSKIGHTNFKE